jgi:hypothetical protein
MNMIEVTGIESSITVAPAAVKMGFPAIFTVINALFFFPSLYFAYLNLFWQTLYGDGGYL